VYAVADRGKVVIDVGFALRCVRGKDELESVFFLKQRLHFHVQVMEIFLKLIGLTLKAIGELSAAIAAFGSRQLVSFSSYVPLGGFSWCKHVVGNFSLSSRRSFRFRWCTGR